MSIDHYLATYGTLGPGRPNHHKLAPLGGIWRDGVVRGHLVDAGWGAAMGYPALKLEPEGEEIFVQLLHCDLLPTQWAALDAFEGDGYRRVATTVTTTDGTFSAWIYVAA
ncbi:gamma-glutamylcyclotransferase [Novosphingobium umbonatum]|uniref:Gamma-glutamylcyclotransferase n=1 Tax=Novosphingobium umbonatum TaxID=1908524 RepID=A0A3S2UTU9_9SPHN|nr:gamma-glutamylcyclotransferase [Novosphingobium umbonatum]RVU06179.1 gamma-glutamylcyclotransferase [Novosphingobium umbonatum]